MVVVVNHY